MNKIQRWSISWEAGFPGRTQIASILFLLLTRAVLVPCIGVAQEAEAWDLPDTPQGHHAAAYLTALNKHDDDHTRAFIREHFAPGVFERMSIDELLREFKIDQEAQGVVRLESHSVKEDGALEVVVASEVTEERLKITLAFEDEAPHRIRGLSVYVLE